MALNLYIGFDLFYPRAYLGDVADDILYVVLQPVLAPDPARATPEPAEPKTPGKSSPTVREYFALDAAGIAGLEMLLVEKGNTVLAEARVRAEFEHRTGNEAYGFTPVPLPRDTTVEVVFTTPPPDAPDGTYRHVIGEGAFDRDPDTWVAIVGYNGLRLPAMIADERWTWEDVKKTPRLSPHDQATLLAWAVDEVGPTLTGNAPKPKPVWAGLATEYGSPEVGPPIKEFLLGEKSGEPGVPRMLYAYRTAWHSPDVVKDRMPRFEYTADALQNLASDAERRQQFPENENSYAERLWKQLSDLLTSNTDQNTEVRTAQALQRLFWIGERFIWPKPNDGSDDGRVLMRWGNDAGSPPLPDDGKWTWTNAHSLAGFTFGIRLGEIANEKQPIKELLVAGKPVKFDFTELNRAIVDFVNAAKTVRADQFRLTCTAEVKPAHGVGRIRYRPKLQDCVAANGTAGRRRVPTALLDALESTAAIAAPMMTPNDARLVKLSPQRIAVRPEELVSLPEAEAFMLGVRVRVERLALPAGARAYCLRVTEPDLDDGDLAAVEAAIRQALPPAGQSGSGDAAATLVLQSKTGGDAVKVNLRQNELRAGWMAADPATVDPEIVLVFGDSAEVKKIDAWFDASQGDRAGEADLLLPPSSAEPGFNTVTVVDEKAASTLTLKNVFEHAYYRGVEHWQQEFALAYTAPDGNPEEGYAGLKSDFQNFRKAWVWLTVDKAEQRLTLRDHLLPVSEVDGPDPAQAYKFVHEFSSPAIETHKDADRASAEEDRFRAYRNAGEPLALQIRSDHLYGYRKTAEPLTLTLPVLSSIVHPATLVAAEPENEKKEQPQPLLDFDIHVDGDVETLVLSTHRRFYQELLYPRRQPIDHGETLVADTQPTKSCDYDALRQLYECGQDLALGNGASLTLYLEQWDLDCTADRVDSSNIDPAAGGKYPSLLHAMRLVERRERVLTVADRPFEGLAETCRSATFAEFLDGLDRLDDEDTTIQLDESWTITGPTGPREKVARSVTRAADVIRVGLRVRRAPDRVPEDDRANRAPGPEDLEPLTPLLPGTTETDRATLAVWGKMAPDAAKQATDYLFGTTDRASPIRESFEWLLAGGRSTTEADALLGPAARTCLVPMNKRPDEAGVVTLYTVPVAFVPLQPTAAANDQESTYALAKYAIDWLQRLCDGKASGLEIETGDQTVDAVADIKTRLAAETLRNTVATHVAEHLCAIVEDDETSSPGREAGELRHWNGYRPFGSDVVCGDARKDNEKLDLVRSLREPAFDQAGSPARLAIAALLRRDLRMFHTAKALAIHLFDPTTLAPRLYSVQVGKQIGPAARDDDRFAFTQFIGSERNRLLLDVLDDALYDNEFEIARDGVLGRTSEDVLENEGTSDKPSVRVNIEPHNPEWRKYDENEPCVVAGNYYVLPSRMPPVTPKPVRMLASGSQQPQTPVPKQANEGETAEQVKNIFWNDAERGLNAWGIDVPDAEVTLEGLTGVVSQDNSLPTDVCGWIKDAHVGWQLLDSHVAHYHFLIAPDEEADPADPLKAFRNDTFRIEIEELDLAADPSPEGSADPARNIPDPPAEVATLLEWFKYRRRIEAGHTAPPEPSARLTPARLQTALETLLSGDGDFSVLRPAGPAVAETQRATRVFRYRPRGASDSGEPGRLVEAPDEAVPIPADQPPMGRLIDARILSGTTTGGGPTTGKAAFVLRFTLLGTAWRRYRCRVRLVRNSRDVDHDGDADMNGRFVMSSDVSPWVDLGAFTVRHTPASLPKYLGSWRPAGVTADEFQNKADGDVVDFGPVIDVLRPEKSAPLLHPRAERPDNRVEATYEAYFAHTAVTFAGVTPRESTMPRAAGTTAASDTGPLFRVMKQDLPSAALRLRLRWLDVSGMPVLHFEDWPIYWPD